MDQPASPPKAVVSGLLSPAFPVVIFLVFLGLAAGLRYGLVQQDRNQVEANLANEARAMANHLERELRTSRL